MTQIKQKIPKLRFPEFSGEWEEKKLGEVSNVRDGTHDSPKYQESGYPLITSKNLLKSGKIDYSNTSNISEEDFININKRSKIDKGDILFGMIGTIGNPVIVDKDDFAIKNVALIKEKKELINLFLINYLRTSKIEKQFYELNAGGTQKFIALGVIRNLFINLPSLPEQEKIANYLSKVDKKIELLGEKKKNIEDYKKGVMQKIFSQELRFKDVPKGHAKNGEEFGEWEEKRFDEILESISTKNYQIYNSEILENGYFKVVDQGQGKISGYSNNENKLYKNGPVIIFGDHTTVLKYIDFDFVIGADGTKILKNKIGNLNYLYYFLDFNKIQPEGYKRHFSIFKKINIFLPALKEQEKIANFLSKIDDKIELIDKKLEETKEFKKGLLQNMFV